MLKGLVNNMNTEALLEGMLFIVGETGLTDKQVQTLLNISKKEAQDVIEQLGRKYQSATSGLRLVTFGNTYKLATKVEHFPAYEAYFKQEKHFSMSQAMLEVASIIAYRQPITRSKIEDVRGVNSDSIVKKLQLLGLIHEVGVEETPGRPHLYGTTADFLDYFGLLSLAELPQLKDFDVKDIEDEVELFMTKYTDTTTNLEDATDE